MAQSSSRIVEWTQGWGVVRQIDERLEFVAFFDTQEDAEAAAATQDDYQVCWVTYRLGSQPGKNNKE